MINNLEVLSVGLGSRSYNIVIGWNILKGLGEYLKLHKPVSSQNFLIISNQKVFSLYGAEITAALEAQGYPTNYFLVPDGEEAKSLKQAEILYDYCCSIPLDRKSCVIALGGGVVGDLAGFVAATYMRGIAYLQVPTTLLAQVDSSVGGKVGINLPTGKNLVGAFYQPNLVYMDLATLTTLPLRELQTGLAEIIKYGVLDNDFFSYLEENISSLLQLDYQVLVYAVKKACQIKSFIVSEDELEQGKRAYLNFGHTIGHAIEAVTNYEMYRHGEAVALGMKWAGRLAVKMNKWSQEEQLRLEQLISKVGLPTELPNLDWSKVIKAMELDKKNSQGRLTMILPERIGHVEINNNVDYNFVKQLLENA